MDTKYVITKGKELSWMLRHDKDAFAQGKIDAHGWRSVSEIIDQGFSQELLDEIVATNNKKRFEYNQDKTMIRARR